MIEHHNVCLNAHDFPGDVDIRTEQPSGHYLWQPGLKVGCVPCEGDGGIEVDMSRIIKRFQMLRDKLVFWKIFRGLAEDVLDTERKY